MSASTPKADPRAAVIDRARVVLWGIGIATAVQAAGAFLAQNRTGAVVAQVVIAEFGTGRLGVAWSDPLAPIQSATQISKRVLRGAGLGAAAAVVLLGASVATHAAQLALGSFGIAPLVVGLLVAACVAARDELLLRGLVLRALGPTAPFGYRLAVCGAAGVAYRFGVDPAVTWPALGFALLSSMALASLWIRDRGAWLAVGANAAFGFVTGPVAQGAVFDVRTKTTLDGTWIAVACAIFFAASAIAYARKDDAPPT